MSLENRVLSGPIASEPGMASDERDKGRVRRSIAWLKTAANFAMRLGSGVLFPKDERTRAQRDALLAFVVRVASAAILYVSQVLLARWMGSHEYGIYVYVWTWVLILGGLSALGLAGGTIRLTPEYKESGRNELALGLARGGRLIALTSGSVVALLGVGGLWLAGDFVTNAYVLPAYLALVCIPLYAVEHVQDGIGRGRGLTAIALVPPFVFRPLLLLAVMGVAHLAGLPMTATTAAVAAILAVWIATIVQWVLIDRRLRPEAAAAKPAYDVRAWLAVSLPLVAAYACELVIQNADVLVVSHYMTPTDVAIYFAAAKTMSLILFVHYAVGSAVAARFSALNARGDKLGLQAFVSDAAKWTFWPSLAGAAIILTLGKPLLALFGPEFAAGYPVMLILVLGFLFRSAMGPAEILLNMLGQQRFCALVMAVTAAGNVALNLLLVPMFGLEGAALASALALSGGALMCYGVARRKLGLDVAIWHNLRRA